MIDQLQRWAPGAQLNSNGATILAYSDQDDAGRRVVLCLTPNAFVTWEVLPEDSYAYSGDYFEFGTNPTEALFSAVLAFRDRAECAPPIYDEDEEQRRHADRIQAIRSTQTELREAYIAALKATAKADGELTAALGVSPSELGLLEDEMASRDPEELITRADKFREKRARESRGILQDAADGWAETMRQAGAPEDAD